jgi:hypothetical protein
MLRTGKTEGGREGGRESAYRAKRALAQLVNEHVVVDDRFEGLGAVATANHRDFDLQRR